MHSFLRSIGFRDISKDRLNEIIREITYNPEHMDVTMDSEGNQFVELRREVAKGIGLSLRGSYEFGDEFHLDYYFPYFTGELQSTNCEVEIIRQSDKESYQGLCDDIRVGIDLIFYLQNMFTLLQSDQRDKKIVDFGGVCLSGLCTEGVVLLPMKKAENVNNTERKIRERNDLLIAARNGDVKAMEKLTINDMDTYSVLQKRLQHEDVLTIVSSYFMPSGIECDKYEVLGEITGVRSVVNTISMESLFLIDLICNHMPMQIVVNEKDLLGEPAIGRRLKAKIWLQGKMG